MYHCIVNPAAGRGKGQHMISAIASFMAAHGAEIDIKMTHDSLDGTLFAKEACTSNSEGIIAVGGDGTLQEIVTGMLDGRDQCKTPLALIPCGSGDDWRRSFNIGFGCDKMLEAVLLNKPQKIDAIRVNKMTCINIGNIGLDAKIVKNAQPFKRLFGNKSYVVSALISIMRHKNTPITIHIDDEDPIEDDFTLVAVCNGQYYGGGMRINPLAVIDDGRITLCLVSALSKLKTLALFPLMLMERHTGFKAIKYIECKKVKLIPKGEKIFCLDGNLYESAEPLEFEILPKAVKVFIPYVPLHDKG